MKTTCASDWDEIWETIENLHQLLANVRQDRREAVDEGWPDAERKYDELEADILFEIQKVKDLLKRQIAVRNS